jgi:hypothetical protein
VNPAINHNQPLRYAAGAGYVEIVRMLLADARIDPTMNDHEVLVVAASWGQVEVKLTHFSL